MVKTDTIWSLILTCHIGTRALWLSLRRMQDSNANENCSAELGYVKTFYDKGSEL